MAHFHQREMELGKRLQKAVGLEGKELLSLDVSLHLAEDEIVVTNVAYVELIDEKQQAEITLVHEWIAKQKVA